MDFDQFMQAAWSDHADQPQAVAQRLAASLDLIQSMQQVAPFAGLVVHVLGEHLAQWTEGVALLNSLRQLPCWNTSCEQAGAKAASLAAQNIALKLHQQVPAAEQPWCAGEMKALAG